MRLRWGPGTVVRLRSFGFGEAPCGRTGFPMSQLLPTASGTLAATPLGHLLIHALDRRLTGSLVFEEKDHRKHAVYLRDGAPVSARTAEPVALLGALAVEHGVLGTDGVEEAVEAATEAGKPLGEVLCAAGVLDEPTLDG